MAEISESVCTWMWPRPDPSTYSLLVKGLAMCLRVSDALKVVSSVCQLGVSHGEEVCFYSMDSYQGLQHFGIYISNEYILSLISP